MILKMPRKGILDLESPNDILVKLLISSQEYEWKSKECDDMTKYPREIHVRKSCPETQYASNLHKLGLLSYKGYVYRKKRQK